MVTPADMLMLQISPKSQINELGRILFMFPQTQTHRCIFLDHSSGDRDTATGKFMFTSDAGQVIKVHPSGYIRILHESTSSEEGDLFI